MKSKTCKQNSDTRCYKKKADKQGGEYSDFRFRWPNKARDERTQNQMKEQSGIL